MIAKMGRVRTQRHDLPRRMYFDHGAYYFVPKGGKKEHLGRDFTEAIKRYAALVQAPVAKMRLTLVMDKYLTEVVPSKKPRTQADYTVAIERLRPVFGNMWPEDIEPHHIYSYLDSRSAKVQGNREVAVLSNILTHAIRKGLLSANPCKQVKRNPESPRIREVTDAEVNALKPHCPEWLQVYLDLKCLIGLRQGDMLKLSRFSIRDDGLFCETGKRGKRLLFNWTPALREVVDRALCLSRKPSEARLFPRSGGTFRGAWQYAMGKAVEGGLISFAENDIRAKVASEAIDMGRDAATMLGHSTDAVTRRHYARGTRKVSPLR